MSKYSIPEGHKIYAELLYWNGETETIEIKEEYIDDIVFAVRGQYMFVDRTKGLSVNGGSIKHVNIFTSKIDEMK